VQRRVKILWFQRFDRLRDQCVVEQYGAKYYALAFFAAWQRAFEVLFAALIGKNCCHVY
jgi:hypothetical protein